MLALDFEFNNTKEELVNLVSCVTSIDRKEIRKWWLHNDPFEQERLAAYLQEQSKNHTILGFSNVAEGRSFISLSLNPMEFNWIDLHIEWRQLTNHNIRLSTGKHLIDGKIVNIRPPKPKWQRKNDEKGSQKLKHSLAECTYKLTGQIRDTDEKEELRNLIISAPKSFTKEQKERILNYNAEDVVHLFDIYDKMIQEYRIALRNKFNAQKLMRDMLFRGKYVALISIRESRGYPIDYEAVKNFTAAVDHILKETQREINNLFPEVMPFRWDKKKGRFTWNQLATRQWIVDNGYLDKWDLTDTYKRDLKLLGNKINKQDYLSLALEAFSDKFPFKHNYPTDNFGAQMLRYLTLKQNLNGFKSRTEKGKKSFWDFVGSDKRVRCYHNPMAAQSGRSQPGSTGFMFLKPAWMRAMVLPPPGKAMAMIDYGSEEFFISALLSGDKNMIEAYLSGDVYLHFAKLAGAVPKEGKREDYEKERDRFKSTVLGISYMMSKYGLAEKLTQDTGIVHTVDQAQELIDTFYDVFSDFAEWQQQDLENYFDDKEIIDLHDGFKVFPDAIEENFRSIGNVRIQGTGSVIMRYADLLCYERGIYVPFTLHDALFTEFDSDNLEAVDILYDSMKEGFVKAFDKKLHHYAEKIKLDITVWSQDFNEGEILYTPKGRKIKTQKKYIDKRAKSYYEKYKYFLENNIREF